MTVVDRKHMIGIYDSSHFIIERASNQFSDMSIEHKKTMIKAPSHFMIERAWNQFSDMSREQRKL